MDLFQSASYPISLLPYEGDAEYFGPILAPDKSQEYFQRLLQEPEWVNDRAVIFGKEIITKRKVAWYGDEAYPYTYSNDKKVALPWIPVLEDLRALCTSISGASFNSCLLNLYHSGEEGMAWHCDEERDLMPGGLIASLSFGASRRFLFRHKSSKETIEQILEPGSLLLMKGATQRNWLHSLPVMKRVKGPRINLTFRTMVSKPA